MNNVNQSFRMSRIRSTDLADHNALAKTEVCIIGAGAIGSNVAYLLGKLGVGRLVIFDDDVVAEENLEPQFYGGLDVGERKVDAIADTVMTTVPDVRITAIPTRFEADQVIDMPVLVSGVDSIESRKEIARALMDQKDHWRYYIDGRMGGNILELYFVTPDRIRNYWFKLLEARPLEIPCSARATSYNGMMIASYIARYVAAISKEQPLPEYLHIDLLGWSFEKGRLQQQSAVL
ncbi:MAG: hypothetical protein GWN93_05875 [Deltaproteobacteria bacterium]|nr:hypothetical protein [Deltaproteobacteria bacterium]